MSGQLATKGEGGDTQSGAIVYFYSPQRTYFSGKYSCKREEKKRAGEGEGEKWKEFFLEFHQQQANDDDSTHARLDRKTTTTWSEVDVMYRESDAKKSGRTVESSFEKDF